MHQISFFWVKGEGGGSNMLAEEEDREKGEKLWDIGNHTLEEIYRRGVERGKGQRLLTIVTWGKDGLVRKEMEVRKFGSFQGNG